MVYLPDVWMALAAVVVGAARSLFYFRYWLVSSLALSP